MATFRRLPGNLTVRHRVCWELAAATVIFAAGCRPGFQLKRFPTNDGLYKASLREYQNHKWENAVAGFEKLTIELPARDTLLARSFWYLASAHQRQGEYLLAAQSFSRLVESFPDDSLADRAALEAARSYRRLWRKPQLDPTYGETALATYNTLLGLYPNSPLVPIANREIGELENWFAIKSYDAGMYYLRRGAYDSAILYFKDILSKWPNTPTVRDASLRLVRAYRAIRYREDASEMCTQLRRRYPSDREVRESCAGVPDALPPTQMPPAG